MERKGAVVYKLKVVFIFTAVLLLCMNGESKAGIRMIKLPEPETKGRVSVEQAIYKRRSVRSFANTPLSLEEVSQILWAAGGKTVDGITGPTRAYPSAGAVYPLEVYLVAGNVMGLDPGVYRYNWKDNSLIPVREGDKRSELSRASLGQRMITQAPATLVVTMFPHKIARAYGKRGMDRYISMDAGHLGQNVHLQAESMGLGTVMVGAFRDDEVSEVLGIKTKEEVPLYIMPVGRPFKQAEGA